MNNTNAVMGMFGLANEVSVSLQAGFYLYAGTAVLGLIAALVTPIHRGNERRM
jgi:hypothetical protein